MLTIPGYAIAEKLYESHNTVIYRATRETDGVSVILKAPASEYPTSREVARFKSEYDILATFSGSNVVRAHTLETHGNRPVLVLEDSGGVSLNRAVDTERNLNLREFLLLAVRICASVDEIHENGIIHKDINPANIIWNRETDSVKVIDFGIATTLRMEKASALEGTLAYISPEQTGRVNRSLDHRSDLYSLGATFHRILTGRPLFAGDDAMEIVHGHIAKNPPAVNEIREDIPAAVAAMIAKLLAKKAEDRYSTALGAQADLRRCLEHLEANGTVEPFELGTTDHPRTLQIPEKLYGREEELATLVDAFQSASAGNRVLVLITGPSGIGKSSLVNEIQKHLVERHGYFASGRFDQLSRNTPYVAIAQALRDLVKEILTESEERVHSWRETLKEAVGQNGRLITEVAPDFEILLGKPEPLEELPPAEAQSRFNGVIQKLIGAIATEEHPFVVFLDDLQWADLPSLALIELIMKSPATRYMSVIGAYRDHEVAPGHPLVATLKRLNSLSNEMIRRDIELGPLALEHIEALIADAMHGNHGDDLRSLAQQCLQKTGGNPFFLNQFLAFLGEESVLRLDTTTWTWRSDLERLRRIEATDNVIDLMVDKINKLPDNARDVLTVAALVGNEFDLDTLAVVTEMSRGVANEALQPALHEGLVLPIGNAYRFVNDEDSEHVAFRFLHGRVQQAAYSMVAQAEIEPMHLKIGRLLLANTPAEEHEERVFTILDHLNLGKFLITQHDERDRLIDLNLVAAKKAKMAAAYGSALAYLQNGIDLLDNPKCWDTHYERTLELFTQGGECAYLAVDGTRLASFSEIVRQHARANIDRVPIHLLEIQEATADLNPKLAVARSIDLLQLLEVPFPKRVGKLRVIRELIVTKRTLAGKSAEDLLNLPIMTDRHHLAVMEVLLRMSLPAYFSADKEAYLLCVLMRMQLSIRYGNAVPSISGYGGYAALQASVFGNFDYGYQLGKLSVSLTEKMEARGSRGRALFVFNTLVRHWREPLRNSLPGLLDAYRFGAQNGDVESATHALNLYGFNSFYSGIQLNELLEELRGLEHVFIEANDLSTLNGNRICRQSVANLILTTQTPHVLVGEDFDEVAALPTYREKQFDTVVFAVYIQKLFLAYLFGDTAAALEFLGECKPKIDTVRSNFMWVLLPFYESLVLLADVPKRGAFARRRVFRIVKRNAKRIRAWAKHSPANHLHKWHLVQAELARAWNRPLAALDHYQKAIELAGRHSFIHEQALACERAATFHMERGQNNLARTHMNDAVYCYQRWGATAKIRQLNDKYPQMMLAHAEPTEGSTIVATARGTTYTTTAQPGGSMDFGSLIKAARIISGEIVMEKLLTKLMRILMENAGAGRGCLFVAEDESYVLKAEGIAENSEPRIIDSIPVNECDTVPQSLIHYVARTRETVVLAQAAADSRFGQDAYVAASKPQSVLCLPFLNKGQLSGILYLENNLTTGAFTPDRLEILRVLSSQVAISIDNARLYASLSESNELLQEALVKATESARLKMEFLANTSHELRTPLNAIINLPEAVLAGFREIEVASCSACNRVFDLDDGDVVDASTVCPRRECGQMGTLSIETETAFEADSTQAMSGLKTVTAQGRHLLQVVTDLLDVSKLEAGRTTVRPERQLVRDLLDKTRTITQEVAKRRRVSLVVADVDQNMELVGDGTKLAQVLINLTDNAIKFSQEGGQVQLDVAEAGDRLTFSVKDDGIGIAEEDHETIFESFRQLDGGHTRNYGGTGLGLAIAKKLTELHGGQLWVESQLGKGSTFFVQLPRDKVAGANAASAENG